MTAKCMFWLAVMFSAAVFAILPVLASQKDLPAAVRLKSLSFSRKIFCLLNAGMLCELCSMYTRFIVAPYEITGHTFTDSTAIPALAFLGVSAVVGAVFFRTLTVKRGTHSRSVAVYVPVSAGDEHSDPLDDPH